VRLSDGIREELRNRLWKEAEEMGWTRLSAAGKARRYEGWTKDPHVGGVLVRFMDPGKVRVYIKDTLLKDFSKVSIADDAFAMKALGIEASAGIVERYIKPHGVRLTDGRILSWGWAEDWKSILMAMHERCFGRKASTADGVVFRFSVPRYQTAAARSLVEDAATKLGIRNVVWLDN
jgi:hypothetical protein